ncbi:DUF748 domain-containing protein [Aequorivita sp. F47161]|uniref:DUF748 domain-containing protein n=1 Tax=Aequorivita vitellina TaxID=2874475 RepID=A0A9X1U2H5_9FLAO|nr:DUF748 domain-containing protein [Aequorivita vitellina]MCG2418563.1 DUF748 domain-containing protein [Aequorivita vitellina]
MNKHLKKIILAVLTLGAVFIIATVSINIFLKNKLESFVNERLPENMIRSYDEITVASFGGSLSITNASLIIKNKKDSVKHTFINVEKLKISQISYWDYLFKDEIHIETISLENPIMAYYKDRVLSSKDTVQKGIIDIYKPIIVNKLIVNNSRFAIYEKSEDSTKLYTKKLSVAIDDIKVDKNTVKRKIPLEFKSYRAKSDSVFVKVSPYENVTVEDFSIVNNNALFEKVTLKTKYSKKKLSQVISTERDHYDLNLQTLKIEAIDFGFNQGQFFAKSKMVGLTAPTLEIYRDKLVSDDLKIKPLYSKMLRELPFRLTVDSLKIKDGNIKYEERTKSENMGGSINFRNLNAAISNVSNTYNSPEKTNIKINANFMDNTPISVDWSFDVNNKTDAFLFKANVDALAANKLNSFTVPNLKVRLEGRTNKTYFTIDGNSEAATTDLKISYSNFKINILQKDGKEKNTIFSAITNIFVSKNSKSDDNSFKEGTATANRDKTKSIFNFLWISIKAALVKIMV